MPITKPFSADMSDISQLQGTCNTWEPIFRAKTSKIELGKDDSNKDANLITFDEFTGDRAELGKARLTEGGAHTAYIKGVSTKITISRA